MRLFSVVSCQLSVVSCSMRVPAPGLAGDGNRFVQLTTDDWPLTRPRCQSSPGRPVERCEDVTQRIGYRAHLDD